MIDLSFVDSPAALEVVIHANTPAYLLRRLLAIPSAARIADRYSAETLLQELDEIASLPNIGILELMRAYLCIAALWHHPPSSVNASELSVRAGGIRWARELFALLDRRTSTTSIGDLRVQPSASLQTSLSSSSNTDHNISLIRGDHV